MSESTSSESEFLCLYLDDFCEEIEVEANEDEDQGSCGQASTSAKAGCKRGKNTARGTGAAKGGSKRKRKMLNKEEKAQVMLSICDVNVDDVLSHVKETVSNERHIIENSARNDFWTGLQSSGKQIVTELLRTLSSLFASLYKSCDKGKDKYMKFQLEWHQCCSVFLLPPDKELSDVGVDA